MSIFRLVSVVVLAQLLLFIETSTLSKSLKLKATYRPEDLEAGIAANMNLPPFGTEEIDEETDDRPSSNNNIGIVWLHGGAQSPDIYKKHFGKVHVPKNISNGISQIKWRFPCATYNDSKNFPDGKGGTLSDIWFYSPRLFEKNKDHGGYSMTQNTVDSTMSPRVDVPDALEEYREELLYQKTGSRLVRSRSTGQRSKGDISQSRETIIDQVTSGIRLVHREIHDLHENEGIPYDRIFLGGFSQGATVATLAALTFNGKGRSSVRVPLGGVLSFNAASFFVKLRTHAAAFMLNVNFLTQLNLKLNGIQDFKLDTPQHELTPLHIWYKIKDEQVDVKLSENGVAFLKHIYSNDQANNSDVERKGKVFATEIGREYAHLDFDLERDGHWMRGKDEDNCAALLEKMFAAIDHIRAQELEAEMGRVMHLPALDLETGEGNVIRSPIDERSVAGSETQFAVELAPESVSTSHDGVEKDSSILPVFPEAYDEESTVVQSPVTISTQARAGEGEKKIGIVWLHAARSDPTDYKEPFERLMPKIGGTKVEWRFPKATYLDEMFRFGNSNIGPFMKQLWFYQPALWRRESEGSAGEFVMDQRTIDRVMRPDSATRYPFFDRAAVIRQLKQGIELVHSEIEALHGSEGIPYDKIFVSGFSQGATMATLSALTFFKNNDNNSNNRLGGVLNFMGPSLFVSDIDQKNVLPRHSFPDNTNLWLLRDLSVAVHGSERGMLHFKQNVDRPAEKKSETCLNIPHFMWYKVQDEQVDRALVENGIGFLRGSTAFTPRVGTANMGNELFLPNVQPIPEGFLHNRPADFDKALDGHCPVEAYYLLINN